VRSKAGPIIVSANGRYFVDSATGQPWLMLADSAQALVNIYGTNAGQDLFRYLTTRSAQGFNGIQFDLVATEYVSAATPYAAQTAGGAVYAFKNNAAITSSWTANPVYWSLMDSYVDLMNDLGLVAILNPYEGHYGSGKTTGGYDLVAAGNPACYSFGQFIGDRYKTKNVVYHLGNDIEIDLGQRAVDRRRLRPEHMAELAPFFAHRRMPLALSAATMST
jgi:hypothetical protein